MRALVIFIVLIAASAHARADAAAKVLFDQGKTLFAEGKYGEACTKLEASFKLAALSSTRGLLGACYEKIGKRASAWAAYRDAAAIAERQGHVERALAARERAVELEPTLARQTIDITAVRALPGLEVTIDSIVQPAAALGEALPVDGGPHVIAADARGYERWETTVDIIDGERARTVVPALTPAPQELEEPAVVRSMSRGRKVALAVTGGGLVVLGVAGVFGALAKINWNGSECTHGADGIGDCPDAAAKRKADAAARDANIATALGVAGLATVAAGVVIFAVVPRYETAPRVSPVIDARGASLVVTGQF